jgi:hypothetical protein
MEGERGRWWWVRGSGNFWLKEDGGCIDKNLE